MRLLSAGVDVMMLMDSVTSVEERDVISSVITFDISFLVREVVFVLSRLDRLVAHLWPR